MDGYDIDPIDADFDDVAKAMVQVATPFSKDNNTLVDDKALALATPRRGNLPKPLVPAHSRPARKDRDRRRPCDPYQ